MLALGSLVVFMLQTFSHCGWEGIDAEHYVIIESCHQFLLDDDQPLCVISNCQQIAGQLGGAPVQKPMDTKQHRPEFQLGWLTLFALAFVLKSTCKSQTRCTFTRDQLHICLSKILLSTERSIMEKVLSPAYHTILGRATKSKKPKREQISQLREAVKNVLADFFR